MDLFLLIFLPLILAFLAHFFLPRSQHLPHKLPSGTMGLPLCGETLAFLKPHKSNRMGIFLQERCLRYGRVFRSHLFGHPTIVSCDLELNMFILQNEGKLFQTSYPKSVHGVLGDYSLLIVSGDLHKKLRSFAVNFSATSKSSPVFLLFLEKLTISTMDSWKGCKEISFLKEVKKFMLVLMVKNVLSIEPGEPSAMKILADFQTYMKGFVSLPLYIPGSPYYKAVKARTRLSSTIRETVKEREMGKNVGINSTKGDFLDVILSKQPRLSDEEIVSISLDILLGGYETTSTLIAIIVYFLGHAPTAFQNLKEEHESIRRSKEEGKPLDLQDYQKMEFTNYVICEGLRCGNLVKFVHRKALRDVKYKDYIIPSEWRVLPVLMGAHFDPSLHENPLEFNPWRWKDKDLSKKVMPFGGGPRLCPGAELAKVEIAFFLHHLVLSYRWKLKEDDDYPVAYPYVEFRRGLLLEIEPNTK